MVPCFMKTAVTAKVTRHLAPRKLASLASALTVLLVSSASWSFAQAQPGESGASVEWPNYAGDKGSSKYSPLAQINRNNFKDLKIAWRWRSVETAITDAHPKVKTWTWECTPLMVNGVLYVSTSLSQVAALNAATGEPLWVYDPETWQHGTPPNHGFVNRGVTYWADGKDRRILVGTGDAYLVCLNAEDGKPISTFGQQGRIDLTEGLGRPVERKLYGVTSPPVICRDVVAVGSSVLDYPLAAAMPPGDVRGFDVRTGALQWTFHVVPHPGEPGYETWEHGSAERTGGANVWTLMSADEELGYLYLPLSTPSNDYYGGDRPGGGLFGESLVCVEARTGRRVWHFQMVHHGLWDYDLPAAPNLLDLTVRDGRKIRAVAQVSKQGFCYVFDRVTGEPVWPIEERPVPASPVPGERAWPTQPFPTKPAPFDRQGMTADDVVDFTPELRQEGLKVLEKYRHGPLFTPPATDKPTLLVPGVAGGASWAGAAADPETGMLYVPSNTLPFAAQLTEPALPPPHARYAGRYFPPELVRGLPLCKPPYGRVTAMDLNTGDHRWMKPIGRIPALEDHPAFAALHLPPTGRPSRGHVLLTKTLLFVAQEGSTQRSQGALDGGYAMVNEFAVIDPKLRAYDKQTGEMVGEVDLPRNATGGPMTYLLNGKQYVVFPTGGANLPPELIALSLP